MEKEKGGILITGVRHPEGGAAVVCHCPGCRLTEAFSTPYLRPPRGGGVWYVVDLCLGCYGKCGRTVTVRYTAVRTPLEVGA
jgi:hypothetical protein